MELVNLNEYRQRETAAVLRAVKAMAKDGEIQGVAMVYQLADGSERVVCTGAYRRRGLGQPRRLSAPG